MLYRRTLGCLTALVLSGAVFLGGMPSAEASETPRQIGWDDLVPEAPPLMNPFTHLNDDQIIELELLYTAQLRLRGGEVPPNDPIAEDAAEWRTALLADGLDVDALLAQYAEVSNEFAKRNAAINPELDGQMVRIPGYALPLEFDGTAVTELLLVPFVGACIHVPPPPANQIVFVDLNQSYVAESLYEPIWITGRMTAKSANKNLEFIDGSAPIEAGYTLEGISIEPYKD